MGRCTGVLSSQKKKVVDAARVQELRAALEGEEGFFGPSAERLLKLVQVTWMVVRGTGLKRKWVQVVAGRWVHVLSFRRPGMVIFDKLWKYISLDYAAVALEDYVRSELVNAMCLCLLFQTNWRTGVSPCTTASDASMSGGAVGMSEELTAAGKDFAAADTRSDQVVKVPIVIVSLFNGIGCAFRCYDACGVVPEVAVSYEVSQEANRVVARRWPRVIIEKDVRDLTLDVIGEWKFKYPNVEAIHIWGGFPCVDLSSAKAFRKNLAGPGSSLFWALVRIIKDVRKVYGFGFPVRFVAENVASMDQSAEEKISRELHVKPWRLDSADAVPIHRT